MWLNSAPLMVACPGMGAANGQLVFMGWRGAAGTDGPRRARGADSRAARPRQRPRLDAGTFGMEDGRGCAGCGLCQGAGSAAAAAGSLYRAHACVGKIPKLRRAALAGRVSAVGLLLG